MNLPLNLDNQPLFQQAMALQQSGRLAEAAGALQTLLQDFPNHCQLLITLGLTLLKCGHFADSAHYLEQAARLDPNQPQTCLYLGIALMRLQRFEAALASYEQAIALKADYADAYCNKGNVLIELKQFEAALQSFETAIAIQPGMVLAYFNRGNLLRDLKQPDRAVDSYEQTIALNPNFAPAYCNLGSVLRELQRPQQALHCYDRLIALQSQDANAFFNRGNVLQDLKRYEEAMLSYRQAVQLKPDLADAYYNWGNILKNLQRFEEALTCYNQAIAANPAAGEFFGNKGLVLQELSRFTEALQSYDQALAINPEDTDALCNRGIALQKLHRYGEALDSFDLSIAINPDCAEFFNNRGNVLQDLKRFPEALSNYRQAIRLNPKFAAAYNNCATVLKHLHYLEEALSCYDQALAIDALFLEAYCNRSSILQDLNRDNEALLDCNQAIAIKADCADAYKLRGVILDKFRQFEDAYKNYEHALAINPNLEFVAGLCLFCKLMLCDWKLTEPKIAELTAKIEQDFKVTTPFNLLPISDDPALQRKAAEIWTQEKYPAKAVLPILSSYPQHKRIRIGYFSEDFRNHPVAMLSAPLYEMHDRNHFEVFGFFFGVKKDEMTSRLEKYFDHFIDIQNLSDIQAAELARTLEIDIAVDLGGHTGNCRNDIFAVRAAPLQVSYLGYAGTLGADYMDYLIADKIVIPEGFQQFYTEKIAHLPNSFMVNDSRRPIADTLFNRRDFDLPESGFVFCSFNNTYKFNPPVFHSWMRILANVPDSVLWLSVDNSIAADHLRQEAVLQGISGDRLIFAQRLPDIEDHLARQRLADLFLDTLPYNAHTTACDALWAGLPVLTCAGKSFAGRVAASVLTAVELPELITSSLPEYEALAVELATHPEKLAALKAKLAANRLTTALFDTPLFIQNIEAAYRQMYQNHKAGLAPEHIFV